jgi:N-carbamoyl-L-amino-acid hydrolase
MPVTNSTGYSMADGIDRIGGDSRKVDEVSMHKGDLAAFLELHIEQGAILDQAGTDIGVVEGIVGINWWDVEVTGMANHAGTTPMDMRRDALLAAARFIVAVNEEALSIPGRHVATVGRIKAEPGAPNVIPGRVLLSLEIRDLSSDQINLLFGKIRERARQIGDASGTDFSFTPVSATGAPALTDISIRREITLAARSLGLSYRNMQSGAGHDAQEMAMIAPTGMIFVPSKDGISHSPKEFTSSGDMANGANVLLRTLLAIDAKNQ